MSLKHKYHDLALNNEDQDRSSSEADESLIGDKSEWQSAQRQTWRSRAWSRVTSNWWIIDTCLLLVILTLLVEPRLQRTRNEFEFAGDLTGFAPRCR